MGKRGFFVVHCLKSLVKPKMFKTQGRAVEFQGKGTDNALIEFQNQQEARAFIKTKEIQIKTNLKLELQSTLKNLKNQEKLKDDTQQDQVLNLSDVQSVRAIREKQVNQLLTTNKVFRQGKYVSSKPKMSLDLSLKYQGFFDGGSSGNPGPSAVGYCINTTSNNSFIGRQRTCNQAQLISMSLLLADAYCNEIQNLKIYGDSQLAINLINQTNVCRNYFLLPLLDVSMQLKKKFTTFQANHISRAYNVRADQLCDRELRRTKIFSKKNLIE